MEIKINHLFHRYSDGKKTIFSIATPRHGAAAPHLAGMGIKRRPIESPGARVCRSTSRPTHPITGLPPILSLNLDMSDCPWRVEESTEPKQR